MSLKFTFGGGSPDHHDHDDHDDHDDHGPGGHGHGIPLPFLGASSSAASSSSNVLELRVSFGDGEEAEVICDALSGDGVSYARAARALTDRSPASVALAVRSAIARTGASLPEPLLPAVSAVVLDLGGAEAAVLAELGLAFDAAADPPAVIDDALQARVGVTAGTPIRRA